MDTEVETTLVDDEPKIDASFMLLFGYAMFAFLFVFVGGWLSLANISGAVIGQGVVIVEGKAKTLQQLESGIVTQILVADGDYVNQGDLLISLDDTLLRANQSIFSGRLRESLARRARLLAERENLDEISWDDTLLVSQGIEDDELVKAGQVSLHLARRVTREGQISQLQEQIAQLNNQILGMTALEESKQAQLLLLKEELSSVRTLLERGLVARPQLSDMERQQEELLGQQGEYKAESARLNNLINETNIQILQIDREFQQSVLSELREVEIELNEASQQLYATLEQLQRVEVRAPVPGIIHELNVFTIGGVISSGSPVLQIIPQNEGFEIEVNIEPQFVDELYVGQLTTLHFSAFNQRTTPEIDGHISTISPNILVDQVTGATFYKLEIEVSSEELDRLNGQQLVPGMPVEAFIQTRQRTPLNYLLKPLLDQVKRAFREE